MKIQWTAALTLCLAGAAHAQRGLGVEAGVFFPASSEIRDRFGDSLVRFGFGPVSTRSPRNGTLTWDVGVLTASERGSRFFVVPVTIGYEHRFAEPDAGLVPYARIAAGVAYYDYDFETEGDDLEDRKFAPAGSLEAGVVFNDRLRFSARYYLFSKVDDLNFNGLQLSATFAVARL